MPVFHSGRETPSLEPVWGRTERDWVLFVWDDFLQDGQSILSSRWYLPEGFQLLADVAVNSLEHNGKAYTKGRAGLIAHSSGEISQGFEKKIISHEIGLVGGSVIKRSLAVLVGDI